MAPRKQTPKKAKKTAPVRRRRREGGEGGLVFLLIFGLFGLVAVDWRVAAIVGIGLVPSFALSLTPGGDHRGIRLQAIVFMNLTGCFPIAMQVYASPSSYFRILTDPITWVLVWGSAASAYALLIIGPVIAAVVLQALAQDELKKLNNQRQQLIETWGSEVTQYEVVQKKAGPGPR